jgi:dTDP-4-dehydrorhamnose reductase
MKIVIIGSGGRLGAALMREYAEKHDVVGLNHTHLDIANVGEIHHNLDDLPFDILINCAAMTDVDLCEAQRARAFLINADAPRALAQLCAEKKAKLIHFSTDYVFDGAKSEPYAENDDANPISVYGESKRAGEEAVLSVQDRHLIVRVSWVFGPDRPSFIDAVVKRAMENENVDAIADKFSTPTYTHDIADMLPIAFNGEGTLHLTNSGQCSWQEYAQHALDCCRSSGIRLKAQTVAPLKLADMKNFVARRPVYSVLSTAKYNTVTGRTPRSWRDAVADYIKRSYSKT